MKKKKIKIFKFNPIYDELITEIKNKLKKIKSKKLKTQKYMAREYLQLKTLLKEHKSLSTWVIRLPNKKEIKDLRKE